MFQLDKKENMVLFCLKNRKQFVTNATKESKRPVHEKNITSNGHIINGHPMNCNLGTNSSKLVEKMSRFVATLDDFQRIMYTAGSLQLQ